MTDDYPQSGGWRRRGRRILLWTTLSVAVLLVAVVITAYVTFQHLNGNIGEVNISGMLGTRPDDPHPQAQNILVIGSDSRQGIPGAAAAGLTTDQSDTMMLIHIPADRKWAEVMSIPRDSWVDIPSCTMGNGHTSTPHQFKINEAFAIGNLYGNHTGLGAACTIKTIEQDTGIFINHFVVVNFDGFKSMVAALGGVQECNPVPFSDPQSGIVLSAGYHWLSPDQALAYVRARYALGNGSDLGRIVRQQAFMSSLVSRAKSELYNPLAIYRFLDAATRSLTVDTQLGGITGLYNLGQQLKGIPASKIAFFTLPNFPRGEVVKSDTANVLWTQPEDSEIFASFRADAPASPSLFTVAPANLANSNRPGKFGVSPTPRPSFPARTAAQNICVS